MQKKVMQKIVRAFKFAKDLLISEEKVILWSRYNILHSNLSILRSMNLSDTFLMLKKSDFIINRSLSIHEKKKERKNRNIFNRAKTGFNKNEELPENVLENSEDYIDSIYARKKMMAHKDENGEEKYLE